LGRQLSILLGLLAYATACAPETPSVRLANGSIPATDEITSLLAAATRESGTDVRFELVAGLNGAEAVLDALGNGAIELAVIENSASYRRPELRTVAPLYPSVLHIAVRPAQATRPFRDLLDGATVFAGAEDSPARRLLSLITSIYEASGVTFSYVDGLDSDPDVVVVFAPISPRRAPMLDGYVLFSMGLPDQVGAGSMADALVLVTPLLRPFIIPMATYGDMTPTAVVTVAIDTLIVTHRATSNVMVYDVLQTLHSLGPRLNSEHPGLLLDRLEDFETSSLTFPVHAGALAFRARNAPDFFERAAGLIDAVTAIAAVLMTALLALVRYVRARRKSRIDDLYARVLDIRGASTEVSDEDGRARAIAELRSLRDEAFRLLMREKLRPDESFRILLTLIEDVRVELDAGVDAGHDTR
jgi:hypothetical protein